MIDHPTGKWKGNPFRRRRFWWTEPGAIILLVMLLAGGAAIEYEVYHLGYTHVLIIFGAFWVILMVIAMTFLKRSQYEVGAFIDRSVVARTKRELDQHRQETLEKFQAAEMEILSRGETTAVLDAWRAQPAYRERHRYFSMIELSAIDPGSKELHLRIQVGEVAVEATDPARLESSLLAEVLRFLKIISSDPYLANVSRFFDALIFELYTICPDELNREIPYSFFSLEMPRSNLVKVASSGRITLDQLRKMCDVRFDSGRPIKPHRGLEAHGPRGAK
ncbi:MAG: hypothetical protein FJ217_10535 [Ignavibacteria bacterium]|nr:hypothetical protein [Ignavibacteria bacterium]